MGDILKVFSGSFWRFVYSWLLPSIVGVGLFLATIYPEIDYLFPFPTINNAAKGNNTIIGLIVTLVSLTTAVLLAFSYSILYGVLEGYRWPKWAFLIGRWLQIRRWKRLSVRAGEHDSAADEAERKKKPQLKAYSQLRSSLIDETLKLHPDYQDQFLPTRLGNAFRATETYGSNRYNLDSQIFWHELSALAPRSLQEDFEGARGVVDFYISWLYISATYSLLAVLVGAWKQELALLIAGGAAALLVYIFYQQAVQSVLGIRYTVQALVNVGRPKLAQAYGLKLPRSLEDEKVMWRDLGRFVTWIPDDSSAYGQVVKALDEWRFEGATGLPDDNDKEASGSTQE
jgi:hypothetical protein